MIAGPRGIEPLTPGLKARCFRRCQALPC